MILPSSHSPIRDHAMGTACRDPARGERPMELVSSQPSVDFPQAGFGEKQLAVTNNTNKGETLFHIRGRSACLVPSHR